MLVQVCQLNLKVGDVKANLKKVFDALERGRERHADLTLFSELTLTGYPPEDLLLSSSLVLQAEEALLKIAPLTLGRMVVVGLPRRVRGKSEKPYFNSAAVFINGELVGFKDKTLLPIYDVFDERRYFEPGEKEPVFEFLGRKIAITICEDAWQHSGLVGDTNYMKDPILDLAGQEVDLMLNLSASPYAYKRLQTRIGVFESAAQFLKCPVLVCNQVGANDQLIFDGHSLYLNEKGEMVQIAKGFVEEDLWIDLASHVCPCALPEVQTKDLFQALVLGVRDYFQKLGFKQAILGLSGGIDSALCALIAKEALGAANVQTVFLPSRFTKEQSGDDAKKLAKNLGVLIETIEIEPIFEQYLDELKPDLSEIAKENLQPRIRANILMALSNSRGSLLLNTSNKSELAMGYSTLYGDLCGALCPLGDLFKTKVYELANFINKDGEIIPRSIIERAPTAELKENQLDTDTLPSYDVLDPILEKMIEQTLSSQEISQELEVSLDFVEEIRRKVHLAEYKRRQAALILRVSNKCFSKGRIIPIVSTGF